MLQPVPGGGIPVTHSAIELKLVFKDGGAFDFHSNFERIKERLHQAVQDARDRGLGDDSASAGMGRGLLPSVDMAAVHLEDLPAYEASSTSNVRSGQPQMFAQQAQPPPIPVDATVPTSHSRPRFEPPNDLPPGYEEVQQESVASELERRLSAS